MNSYRVLVALLPYLDAEGRHRTGHLGQVVELPKTVAAHMLSLDAVEPLTDTDQHLDEGDTLPDRPAWSAPKGPWIAYAAAVHRQSRGVHGVTEDEAATMNKRQIIASIETERPTT